MNNLAIAAIIASISAFGGWTARDWKADTAAARVEAEHAKAIATANADTFDAQHKLDALRDRQTAAVRAVDTEQTELLRKANEETKRLRLCIDNGTCGLRVNVVRTEPATILPGTANAGGVGDGAGARLTADAQQNYFALRDGITRIQRKLDACQSSLRVIDTQRP